MSTTLQGLGFAPLGTSPLGWGKPAASDPQTASKSGYGAVSSVSFDPHTADVEIDAYGSEESMTDAQQRVYFCLKTIRGTRTAFPDFGLQAPRKILDDMQTEIYELVRVALAPVLDDGSITLDAVRVETIKNTVCAAVIWTDTRRQKQYPSNVPLG